MSADGWTRSGWSRSDYYDAREAREAANVAAGEAAREARETLTVGDRIVWSVNQRGGVLLARPDVGRWTFALDVAHHGRTVLDAPAHTVNPA